MRTELRNLITSYQDAAARLVPKILDHLGVTSPSSNFEWATLKVPGKGVTPCGKKYRKHGFGIEITYEDGVIDFDFGENGDIDGLDAWFLYDFAVSTGFSIPYIDGREIKNELEEAVLLGELRRHQHRYYLIDR
jgi:hypothetical protein